MRRMGVALATVAAALVLCTTGCGSSPADEESEAPEVAPEAPARGKQRPARGKMKQKAGRPAGTPEEGTPSNHPTGGIWEGSEVVHYGGLRPDEEGCTIIAMHGLGGSPKSLQPAMSRIDFPARVVYLRGPLEIGAKGRGWFRKQPPGQKDAVPGLVRPVADALAAGIADVGKHYPTRGKPVITGFSQGGFMTWSLATRHPGLMDVAIPVAGRLVEDPKGRAPADAPVIHSLHGVKDTVVPVDDSRRARKVLTEKGWTVTLKEYPPAAHSITPAMNRDYMELLAEACR